MTYKPKSVAASTVNIVNGTAVEASVANVPHDQAYDNVDNLASVFNADRNMVIRGGGVISWDRTTEILTFGASINISVPNENIGVGIGGVAEQVITSGSVSLAPSKQIAAIKISRTATPVYTVADIMAYTNMTSMEAAIAAESPASETARFEYVILATREPAAVGGANDNITLWDGRRIRHGESVTNAGATDTQYAQQADFTAKSIDENQDRNTYLLGGGILTWNGPGNGLQHDSDFTVFMPDNVLLQLAAGTLPSISNSECYVVTFAGSVAIDRADNSVGPISAVVRAVNHADVDKTNDDLLVLAVCLNDRLHLMDGTVLEDGFKMRLGGLATGVRWIFTGPGTGVAAYDFSAVGGSIVRPAGATPEFYAGGSELMVYVNGVRMTEGRYCLGAATTGDYDEPAITTTPQTTVTWTPSTRPIPTAADRVVAFVGLANPNIGPTGLDNLILADNAGVTVATVDLSSEDVREDHATVPTVVFGATASGAEVSVGEVVNEPVQGSRAQGTAYTHGMLRAFPEPPQIFFDDTDATNDYIYLSPGEIAVPDSYMRGKYHVHRLWTPLKWSPVPTSPPPTPGGFVYIYLRSGASNHDQVITAGDLLATTVPPQMSITTYKHWLSHPTNNDRVYLGCCWVKTSAGPTFDYVRPFDRAGDRFVYRSGGQSSVLSDATGWGALGGQIASVSLADYVPETAHAAILQAQLTVDMTSYVAAGGSLITGVAFYGAQSTPPGNFPAFISHDHDIQYLVHPNKAATVVPTEIYSWAPFILPVNDLSAGSPAVPTFDVWLGPYTDKIDVHVVGFIENPGAYRHR